jgi:hypothetical protein
VGKGYVVAATAEGNARHWGLEDFCFANNFYAENEICLTIA